jgi:hypothetical protein
VSGRELTFQQLDPLWSLGARLISILVAVAACGYAVLADLFSSAAITQPGLAVVAIIAIVAAACVIIVASSPYRAPLTGRSHAVAHALAFVAVVLSAVSRWDVTAHIRTDWGPLSLGLLLVAVAPYRPARELVASSSLSAIGVAFLVMLQARSFVTPLPIIVFAVFTVVPIISLAWAAAAFSASIVHSLDGWQLRARQAAHSRVGDLHNSIAHSVRHDRLTILNRDVMPFFAELLGRSEILPADRERARLIADSIRTVMVAEVDRTWLDGVIELSPAGGQTLAEAPNRVSDNDRLAELMTTDQRTAVRALLGFILDSPGLRPGSLQVTIVDDGPACRVVLVAGIRFAGRARRSIFTPYFAVMRLVFHDLKVKFLPTTLTVRFSYDR